MSSRLKCSAQVSRCRCCEGSTGRGVAIFAFGTLLQRAKQPAARLDATLVNMRFVKPLDGDLILSLLAQHDLLVTLEEMTLEENVLVGGAGAAVAEFLTSRGVVHPLPHLGSPDRFVAHGNVNDQFAQCGLDEDGIYRAIRARRPPQNERATG